MAMHQTRNDSVAGQRRDSRMSSHQSIGGHSSLRDKISNSLKQRANFMRRMSTKKQSSMAKPNDGFEPGMSMVEEEIKEEINDGETEWGVNVNDIENMSESLNMNYDVIENARDDSPYYQACINALEHYKSRVGGEAGDINVEKAAKSK